jgi:prephenate dehydratase
MSKPQINIGIQGGRGSFSEEAAMDFCERHGIEAYEFEYLFTSENVLQAVETSRTKYGIMAMENAQGGVVIETVIALAEHRCQIAEMFHIDVRQCLLGRSGVHPGDVTEIHSHPQALRQCREYLADHFWTRPLIEEDDTAHAAERLAAGKLPTTAAVIGSQHCANLYGLEVLKANIQDLKNNLTLFLGVTRWETEH